MTVALAYLAVCVVWGTTYLAIKVALEGFDPFFMGGVRFLIAGCCLVPIVYIRQSVFPRDRKTLAWIVICGLLLLSGANGLVNFAEVYLDSGLTALTICTSPAWAALIGGIFYSKSERLSWQSLAGIITAMAGVYVLHHDRLDLSNALWVGVAASVSAPFLWANGSLLQRRFVHGADAIVVTTLQCITSSFAFFAISWSIGESWIPELTARVVWSMVFLILAGTVLTYVCYAYLLKHVPASRATTYAFVNPVIALIAGNLILSEPITKEIYPATFLILGGLLLVYWGHYGKKPLTGR